MLLEHLARRLPHAYPTEAASPTTSDDGRLWAERKISPALWTVVEVLRSTANSFSAEPRRRLSKRVAPNSNEP